MTRGRGGHGDEGTPGRDLGGRDVTARDLTGEAAPSAERPWPPSGQYRQAAVTDDALGVIAADAIGVIAGERDVRLALCASPTCRAAFFDTSQSRTRKWCDMNTCGNRQKKARFLANRRDNPGSAE